MIVPQGRSFRCGISQDLCHAQTQGTPGTHEYILRIPNEWKSTILCPWHIASYREAGNRYAAVEPHDSRGSAKIWHYTKEVQDRHSRRSSFCCPFSDLSSLLISGTMIYRLTIAKMNSWRVPHIPPLRLLSAYGLKRRVLGTCPVWKARTTMLIGSISRRI